MKALDAPGVTWVDDDGTTWRVEREGETMWTLKRYAPESNVWKWRGRFPTREDAITAATP